MSTTAVGSSQNSGGTSSTQTNGGDPRQSTLRVLSPVQDVQGDAELNQIQVQDWDEEAEEAKEELARVQQEKGRIWQEQESIMRRQVIAQRAQTRRQHISREPVRLVELQYTIDILHQQEQELMLGQRQHQPSSIPPPPPPQHTHIPPPPPPFKNIMYH
jgi:hypothetical protein